MSLTSLLYLGGILFGGGGLLACAAWLKRQGEHKIVDQQDKERANVAEKRLDIANKPSDTPDDTSDWLSGK